MQPRTKRQKQVLKFLVEFIEEHGYEPSYQQIALHFNVKSKGGIARHIEALEKQGFILRKRDSSGFHLTLLPEISDSVYKIEWLEIPQDFEKDYEKPLPVFVPKVLFKNTPSKNTRVFRVSDDSMIDEHILEGDIALVEERKFARDRDCIVALIKGEIPVLRNFYRDGANIDLRSANVDFESINISADKIEILAVFRGLLRPLNF